MNFPERVEKTSSSLDKTDDKVRLKELSHEEMVKMYGRGYKLLLKAGFTSESAKTAPIKVHLRKPREGLKDDDSVGRRALGDQPRSVQSVNDMDEYLQLYPRIQVFLESCGGSCSVKTLFYEFVRPAIPHSNLSIFTLVVSVDNKYFYVKSGTAFLKKAPAIVSHAFPCICCNQPFSSIHTWAWHVFRTLDQMHGQYEQKLLNVTAKAPGLATYTCLACLRVCDYPNLLRLVHHCRTMNDEVHDVFGLAIINVFLTDKVPLMDSLFLTAIENGDADFPYKHIVDNGSIPFEPTTPIDLSSDEDEVQEIEEIQSCSEIVDLDN